MLMCVSKRGNDGRIMYGIKQELMRHAVMNSQRHSLSSFTQDAMKANLSIPSAFFEFDPPVLDLVSRFKFMKRRLVMLWVVSGLALGATTATQAAVTATTATSGTSVSANLSSPSNAALGAITIHSLTIQDNNSPTSVAFGSESSNGAESPSFAPNQLLQR
jgi:hypothetical protein